MNATTRTLLIAHVIAFTRLFDLYTRLASTKDILKAFADCRDTLHDLLKSAPELKAALSAYEHWLLAHDDRQRAPTPPRT